MCRTLHCTLRELMQRMDIEELAIWRSAYELEPWGDRRLDWNSMRIRNAVIAFSGNLAEGSEPPEDWPLALVDEVVEAAVEAEEQAAGAGGGNVTEPETPGPDRLERHFARQAAKLNRTAPP